ncbi:hypothetical protein [Alkalihalobacterium elongatum]|uniref:hypothetical protein n=1 Tax=Alkalihalobacterium elongatum TaxID=2675466 RepID=UPI001C1FDDD5|nr:hypothetical protein [Alkalihalobacterium elongatum]
MLDKSYTFKTTTEVLKEVIIPHINNSMAKEQAIALISVLKNLDMQTIENLSPKAQLNLLISETIHDFIGRIQADEGLFRYDRIVDQLMDDLNEVNLIEDTNTKWSRLNELQCTLIQALYKESLNNTNVERYYITPLRQKLREQLNIEIALVR